MNERTARRIVRERADGKCEGCGGKGTDFAHRKARSQGGKWAPSNALLLCGSGTTGCHGWQHANPTAARGKGWTVPSWADPSTLPVLLVTGVYGRAWVFLDDEGCVSWHEVVA